MVNGKKDNLNSEEHVEIFKKTNIITSFTVNVLSNILVGGFLGYYIDKWTFNNKIIFIIFLFLGIISGMYNGIKMLLKEAEKADEKRNKD